MSRNRFSEVFGDGTAGTYRGLIDELVLDLFEQQLDTIASRAERCGAKVVCHDVLVSPSGRQTWLWELDEHEELDRPVLLLAEVDWEGENERLTICQVRCFKLDQSWPGPPQQSS